MCGSRIETCAGISPPISPDSISGEVRDTWMRDYPRLLGEYYALLRQVVVVDGCGSLSSGGCDCDSFGEGASLQANVDVLRGSCVPRCVCVRRSLLADVDGVEVYSSLCGEVDKEEELQSVRGKKGGGIRRSQVPRLEWNSTRGSDLRHEFRFGTGSEKVVPVIDEVLGDGIPNGGLRTSFETFDAVDSAGVLEEKRNVKKEVEFKMKGNVADDSKESRVETCVPGSESKVERNRRWRAEKKQLKKKRQAMQYDWRLGSSNSPVVKKGSSELHDSTSFASEEDAALKSSLKAKWKIQNELAVEKARRELEVLKANDIDQEVKRYRTKISAATERNMVSIEKTHAMLRQTGNLSEERGGGFVETVVSGVPGLESGSGTISPDSSASMAEFRACQKALLDAEREIAEYKRKIKIASEKYGFPLEQVDFLDKEVWTDTQTNQDILDEIYPNGYGKDTSLFEDGKFRAIGV